MFKGRLLLRGCLVFDRARPGDFFRPAMCELLVRQERVHAAGWANDAAEDTRKVTATGHEVRDPRARPQARESRYSRRLAIRVPCHLIRRSRRISDGICDEG